MSKQILIIGGGVIGLCSAYYAALAGHQVTVVDRNAPARDGCSFGNAGMIVPSHFIPLAAPGMVEYGIRMMGDRRSPFHVRPRLSADLLSWGTKFCMSATAEHVRRASPVLRDLNLASRAAYVELAGDLGEGFGLTQNGLLMLCKTEHTLEEETHVATNARRLGLAAEPVTPTDLQRIEPNLTMDVAGGVYFPGDCHLNPSAFVAAVQHHLESLGVKFYWGYEATDLDLTAGMIDHVTLQKTGTPSANGDNRSSINLQADEYVLAGGSWSPVLAAKVGLDLPMQAGKGYSLTLDRPAELPKVCAILVEARVAVTPMGSTLRVGGTMQIAGLDESIDTERVAGIVSAVPKYFPAFAEADFAGIKPWRGLRPCSPDGLPYLGRTSRASNLILATGHAMMGLSLAPITGKLVQQLIAVERPAIPIEMLSPERFE